MKIFNNFLKNKIKTNIFSKFQNINIDSKDIITSNFNNNKNDIINTILLFGWGIHEHYMLTDYDIYQHYTFISIIHMMILIWQYVGLFIISHDLHHNKNRTNYQNLLGRLSLLFYGGFFLEDFSEKHEMHHKYPGQFKDPDFYDGNVILWYLNFMVQYINLKQVLTQLIFYNVLKYFQIENEQMILFWLLPSVLASIQLFFYGTYMVHEKNGIIKNSKLPKWLITLTSYNFGNHVNHHKNPELPWFDLN